MTPPTITAMKISKDTVTAGEVVRFSFGAEDSVSGVQKNYYVNISNNLFLPVGQELFVPFLTEGDQTIVLRVYDNAGNYIDKSQTIHVGSAIKNKM